jgi:hypothetical protein
MKGSEVAIYFSQWRLIPQQRSSWTANSPWAADTVPIILTPRRPIFVFNKYRHLPVLEQHRSRKNWALLGYYAVRRDNSLTTFRDNLRGSLFFYSRALNMRTLGCPETSVRNDHYLLRNSSKGRGYRLTCGWRPNHSDLQSILPHTFPQSCLKIRFRRVRIISMGNC